MMLKYAKIVQALEMEVSKATFEAFEKDVIKTIKSFYLKRYKLERHIDPELIKILLRFAAMYKKIVSMWNREMERRLIQEKGKLPPKESRPSSFKFKEIVDQFTVFVQNNTFRSQPPQHINESEDYEGGIEYFYKTLRQYIKKIHEIGIKAIEEAQNTILVPKVMDIATPVLLGSIVVTPSEEDFAINAYYFNEKVNQVSQAVTLIERTMLKPVISKHMKIYVYEDSIKDSDASGLYKSQSDEMKIGKKTTIQTIVHEFGHRYWFKLLNKGKQNDWDDFFEQKKSLIKNHISTYAATNREEAFAEVFAFYVMNKPLHQEVKDFFEWVVK